MSDARTLAELTSQQKVAAGLRRRYRAERRFQAYGMAAVGLGILFVVLLFYTIISKGYSAFEQTYLRIDVSYPADVVDPNGRRAPADLAEANYEAVLRASLRAQFPNVTERAELRTLYSMLSDAAEPELRSRVLADPGRVGRHESLWLLAGDRVDMLVKGHIDRSLPEADYVRSATRSSAGSTSSPRSSGSRSASTRTSSPAVIRASPSRPAFAARSWDRCSRCW